LYNNFFIFKIVQKFLHYFMDFINEKLKTTYTSIFKELQPLDFESTRDMIYDICSKNPELWDLSEDKDGSIHDGYFNNMILFLESLY